MHSVVIGATKGLGLALTRKMLSAGHKVVAGVVERQVPEDLAKLSDEYGDKLLIKSCDIADENEVKAFADNAGVFLGKADNLCVVAGILLPDDAAKPLHLCDVDVLRKTFEVNVFGPIMSAKYFYPIMEKGGKVIIVTSEGVGVKNVYSNFPCYALSKTVATKASGIFNASVDDVDFYAVHPGRMRTDMNQTSFQIEPEEAADGIFGIMIGSIPVSRDIWYIDYKGDPMEM
ncbi:MAG: SDR family NAD(P)-dependent oxidoreductase [Defluviitaleaceae bacterium]|nr:SDR family NAD(P)-dependent oxidoreductase [Defluviitaleaceae bacterium]